MILLYLAADAANANRESPAPWQHALELGACVAEDKAAEPAVVLPLEEAELGGTARSGDDGGEAEDVAHAPRGKAVGDMEDGERGEGKAEFGIATARFCLGLFLFYFLPIQRCCVRLLQPVLLRRCCIIRRRRGRERGRG